MFENDTRARKKKKKNSAKLLEVCLQRGSIFCLAVQLIIMGHLFQGPGHSLKSLI